MSNMTDKEKSDRLLAAYETFKKRLDELKPKRDAAVNGALQRLEKTKLDAVLKRINSF